MEDGCMILDIRYSMLVEQSRIEYQESSIMKEIIDERHFWRGFEGELC